MSNTRIAVHVIEGAPILSNRMRHVIRSRYVAAELERIEADMAVGPTGNGVCVYMSPLDVRTVDGLAALGLLIELPDGAGTQAAWSALLTLPEIQ